MALGLRAELAVVVATTVGSQWMVEAGAALLVGEEQSAWMVTSLVETPTATTGLE